MIQQSGSTPMFLSGARPHLYVPRMSDAPGPR